MKLYEMGTHSQYICQFGCGIQVGQAAANIIRRMFQTKYKLLTHLSAARCPYKGSVNVTRFLTKNHSFKTEIFQCSGTLLNPDGVVKPYIMMFIFSL